MTDHQTPTPTTANKSAGQQLLRAQIATFLHRRRIEATAAASLIALSTYSQAYALSVSEVQVQSALGQPLRATVNIELAGGEIVNGGCLTLRPPAAGGMPGVGPVSLSLLPGVNAVTLDIRGSAPMREPMSEMVLNIDCSGTPAMTRSFLVLLDPPAPIAAQPAPAQAAVASTATTATPSAQPVSQRPRAPRYRVPSDPIEAGSRYTVQPGDILSVIASRVANRPDYTVWPIAQRIYDTNPDAFDSQAPDSLRVGATLDIPRLVGNLAVAGTPAQVRRVLPRSEARRSAARTSERSLRLNQSAAANPATLPRAVDTFAMTETLSAATPEKTPTAPAARSVDEATVERPSEAIVRRRQLDEQVAAAAAAVQKLTDVESGADAAPTDEAATTAAAAPSEAAQAVAPPTGAQADGGTADNGAATPTPPPAQTAAPVTAPVTALRAPNPLDVYADRPLGRGSSPWIIGIAALLGAALGGIATLFGAGRWIASKRAEQEAALARAKRHEQRLEEARRQRTSADAPSIVVQEQVPAPQAEPPKARPKKPRKELPRMALPRVDAMGGEAHESVGSIDEVMATTIAGRKAKEAMAELDTDAAADKDPSLMVDAVDPNDELDFNVFDEPDESALALLEKDYAQAQVGELEPDPEATAMLTPEQLGLTQTNSTQLMRNSLDLELPQSDPEDTVLAVEQLGDLHDDGSSDLTAVAEQLEAELQALSEDNDPTSESPRLTNAAADVDDDPTSSIDTRDATDYYHLEASSIRKVGTLAFERDDDDDDTLLVSSLGK